MCSVTTVTARSECGPQGRWGWKESGTLPAVKQAWLCTLNRVFFLFLPGGPQGDITSLSLRSPIKKDHKKGSSEILAGCGLIAAFERLRQEDLEREFSLDSLVKPCLTLHRARWYTPLN